jgi:hypothetical protein
MELGKGTCGTCAGLIRLCSGLDFFPTDIEVKKLLIERLHRVARNHEHATAIVEKYLETETVAPKVADFVKLSSQVLGTIRGQLPSPCDICSRDGGYFVATVRGAKRCSCARGLALQAMDRVREREQEVAAERRRSS